MKGFGLSERIPKARLCFTRPLRSAREAKGTWGSGLRVSGLGVRV